VGFLGTLGARAEERRVRVASQRVLDLLRERLVRDALGRLEPGDFDRMAREVATRLRDPYSAVDEILERGERPEREPSGPQTQ
jgi:hypothetical protein